MASKHVNFAISYEMKRLYLAIAILGIALISFVLLRKNLNSTTGGDLGILKLQNPKQITKILLAPNNKKQDYIMLFKQGQKWMVKNSKMTESADTHAVRELLFWVMTKAEVKNPVSDAAKDNVTRELALNGVKALFYKGETEIQEIYVGSATPDQLGTYMYHKEMERPAVVQIAGFNGYLSPYFTLDIDAWRSPVILDMQAEEIASVKTMWPGQEQDGFEVRRSNGTIELLNHQGKRMVDVPENRLMAYLERFSGISREYGETAGINRKPKMRDSILRSAPFCILEIQGTNGTKTNLQFYRIGVSNETYAPITRDGQMPNYETDLYWVHVTGKPELWMIQGVVINSRLKTLKQIIQPEINTKSKP
jgi:hypothetical protein